ncbi:MAG: AtpZ/AtpI family protein [Planctomycetaceae bacterium]|nr:AtpZ/AtpI family protein [Planctomycetaceae bacterium]
MPRPRSYGQSGLAVGMYWATRVSSVGVSIAVPTLIGFWLDRKWETSPWLVVAGACVGFLVGMLEFVKLMRQQQKPGAFPGSSRQSGDTR